MVNILGETGMGLASGVFLACLMGGLIVGPILYSICLFLVKIIENSMKKEFSKLHKKIFTLVLFITISISISKLIVNKMDIYMTF